jgi:hypothetical protein
MLLNISQIIYTTRKKKQCKLIYKFIIFIFEETKFKIFFKILNL